MRTAFARPASTVARARRSTFSPRGHGLDEQPALVEGEDFYREGAAIVFTARYHLKRGYCCESGCRHCPYRVEEETRDVESKNEDGDEA